MAKPKEVQPEEQTEEQRVARMEFIFQKLGGLLGGEFAPPQYDNGGEQQLRFIKDGKKVSLFIFPRLKDEMRADIRLLVQKRGGGVFISQIPGAFIHEEEGGITFSENGENGTGQSLSFKEDGEIVPSL